MTPLSGHSLLGLRPSLSSGRTFRTTNPTTDEQLPTSFHEATPEDVAAAGELARQAAPVMAALSGAQKAGFLRALAEGLEEAKTALTTMAMQETGLTESRCQSEIARTTGQLRLFADLVAQGDWVDARIEHADPSRLPRPKPDHRSMRRPLGPVGVFCAGNFPFAYSVAGGDTASAFAAGCPVIVLAHHAHAGTAEMTAHIVTDAVERCGLPEGAFSLLQGDGRVVGQQLARHPALRAIGFTGSRSGGRALMDTAAARPQPIPVYAEMSSVNPVFLTEAAVEAGGATLVAGLHGSCTEGGGQFCTKPGLIILIRSATTEKFAHELARLFAATEDVVMLNGAIHQAYVKATDERTASPAIASLARGLASGRPNRGVACLLSVDAADFLATPALQEETFGPASLIVWCADRGERDAVAAALQGNLTATLHATDAEIATERPLLEQLTMIAGRVILNGFPTGVEVSTAMVHGGPYPALSDGRTTSVGTAAIERFTRAVCYQNFPQAALPPELQDLNLPRPERLVDGRRRR